MSKQLTTLVAIEFGADNASEGIAMNGKKGSFQHWYKNQWINKWKHLTIGAFLFLCKRIV